MFEIIAKGGIVMIPLIGCSVTSVAVIIERTIFWIRQKRGVTPAQLLKMAEEGRFEDLIKEAGRAGVYPPQTGFSDKKPTIKVGATARVILSGVTHQNPSPTLAMEATAIEEAARMKRYLPAMDTIITLAPLLGLLGTIIGMIQSFGIMSVAGIGQPHAVTGGVAEALIATAAGLTVAIVTLIPYNYFLSKVEKATGEMEEYATKVEMVLRAFPSPPLLKFLPPDASGAG